MTSLYLTLFGGKDSPWDASTWRSQDDRVRGGASTSRLIVDASLSTATFEGHLDTQTLGGAGFASQRTADPQSWDLGGYDGLVLDVAHGDGKKYTLVLKDAVPPRRPDGREESSVSWEFDFTPPARGGTVAMAFADFRPTYRGREKPDAEPLDLGHIRRISFMMRSFFGEQEGDFAMAMNWLAAVRVTNDDWNSSLDDEVALKEPASAKGQEGTASRPGSLWRAWLCGWGRSKSK